MLWIDWLPTVAPQFGVMSVSFSMTRIRLMSWSSSSATIIESPVADPWPSSTLPSFTEIVLSGWTMNHESSWFESNGPYDANSFPSVRPGLTRGSTAAPALPATAAPATEKPTTSAPPPLTNERRENSFSGIKPGHHAPPFAITAAAFWIAVRILGYVPQRQRCPFIAVRIWSSDGFFVVARRSAAWIIIPFWQ